MFGSARDGAESDREGVGAVGWLLRVFGSEERESCKVELGHKRVETLSGPAGEGRRCGCWI